MTSILNYLDSSSNSNVLGGLSNLKYPTTFIIQPPSSNVNKPTTLLTKRYRPAELGDLLMKKIKTQTSNNSETNSESHSMIEEPRSPQSLTEDVEKTNGQKSIEGILFPQRSVSTPLFGGACLRPSKMGIAESHKYVQNALEALEKKILLEQQVASLRDTILKTQLSQEPLYIPPLVSSTSAPVLPKKVKGGKNTPQDYDDEPEVIVGPVEFPLLSMATPLLPTKNIKCPKPLASLYESSKPTEGSFLDSLTVTRAETQRSDSDSGSEDLSQAGEGKKKRGKKASSVKSMDIGGKVKKVHKKDQEKKTKSRQQKKDELLSPILSSRRLMERKKNKWQLGGDVQQDQKPSSEMNIEGSKKKVITPLGPKYQVDLPILSVRGQSNERRSPKMKWDPLSQDEGELHNFFEGLRNLLNYNVDQEKAIKLLKENNNDVQKVLESVEANKDKYVEELAIQNKN